MATMKMNNFEEVLTQNTGNFVSPNLESNKNRFGTVKVSRISQWELVENKQISSTPYPQQSYSFIQVPTPSFNPIQYNLSSMDISRQYHPRVQKFAPLNLIKRRTSVLPQPFTHPLESTDLSDKRMKQYNELFNESSLKTLSSETDQLPSINSNPSYSLYVKNSRLPNISSQRSDFHRNYGQTYDYHKRKKQTKQRKYCNGLSCCSCSVLCILLTLVALILLGAIIGAIIIGISIKQKTTLSTITSTTTISTSTTVTTTSTTSTTASTTTTSSYICNTSCLNQTWQSSLNPLSKWLFDESFNDVMTNYNATSLNNVSFTTNGYVRQAAVFIANASQMLNVAYMPLSYTSFTIEIWLYITGLQNLLDQSIFGLCPSINSYECLHLTIRQSSSNYHLFLGFYNHDCEGTTPLTLNKWIHAAFVFDMTLMKQIVYLDGVVENSCSVSSAVTVNSSTVTIGYISALVGSPRNYFQGYMDQLTVSTRAKPSCEILEDAILAAYFTFNSGLLLVDTGPNSLQATTQSTSTVLSGRFAQAITFSGSSSSYFQISGLTTLGISNKSFSISLWIRPVSLSGVLVHVSSNASGLDWCLPFIGFATNGSIVVQILNSNGIISVLDSSIPISASAWSHIVQTWSSTNGLRLYIDGILVATRLTLATTYTASMISNYVTLGNSLSGNTCGQGQIGTLAPYHGDIDDFRVYSRELTAADVCRLYIA